MNQIIKIAYAEDKFFWSRKDLEEFELFEEFQVWKDLKVSYTYGSANNDNLVCGAETEMV